MQDLDTTRDIPEHEVRSELDRLLRSPLFLQSDRLGRFLRFAIENALSGKSDLLKEYVIGTEIYGRKPPYHPSQDSIVRTEARRLRAKLKEYCESEGGKIPSLSTSVQVHTSRSFAGMSLLRGPLRLPFHPVTICWSKAPGSRSQFCLFSTFRIGSVLHSVRVA